MLFRLSLCLWIFGVVNFTSIKLRKALMGERMNRTKIAFTSCMRIEAFPEQPVWRTIDEVVNPDYLLLLGDQIYMDFGVKRIAKEPVGSPKNLSLKQFVTCMDNKYQKQWLEPNFSKLFSKLSASGKVYGVWDDHDFAWDDAFGLGDGAVPDDKKEASRRLFNKWVYGEESDQDIYRYVDLPHARVIFLDCRYYSQKRGIDASLLGEEQFSWLESALEHDKLFTVIANGITLTQTPDAFSMSIKMMVKNKERWEKYEREFIRLKRLLSSHKRILYLAGDIHRNAFAEHSWGESRIYEVVSSGAAIDHLGFRGIDARRNFGVLDYDEKKLRVQLWSMERPQIWTIDIDSWLIENQPEKRPNTFHLMNGAARVIRRQNKYISK